MLRKGMGSALPGVSNGRTSKQLGWLAPLLTAALSVTHSVAAQSVYTFPGQVFAPYVDLDMVYDSPAGYFTGTHQQTGVKHYTLAFVLAGADSLGNRTCRATWGGHLNLDDPALDTVHSDITSLRHRGGDVIVSFGGWNGTELAQVCTSDEALRAQYQAVIDKYQATRVDFDVEGDELTSAQSIARRSAAIALLQNAARAAKRPLVVSFTLQPSADKGLDVNELSVLESAVRHDVEIGAVNLMVMNYGQTVSPEMGQNAISAATAVVEQLKKLLPTVQDVPQRAPAVIPSSG